MKITVNEINEALNVLRQFDETPDSELVHRVSDALNYFQLWKSGLLTQFLEKFPKVELELESLYMLAETENPPIQFLATAIRQRVAERVLNSDFYQITTQSGMRTIFNNVFPDSESVQNFLRGQHEDDIDSLTIPSNININYYFDARVAYGKLYYVPIHSKILVNETRSLNAFFELINSGITANIDLGHSVTRLTLKVQDKNNVTLNFTIEDWTDFINCFKYCMEDEINACDPATLNQELVYDDVHNSNLAGDFLRCCTSYLRQRGSNNVVLRRVMAWSHYVTNVYYVNDYTRFSPARETRLEYAGTTEFVLAIPYYTTPQNNPSGVVSMSAAGLISFVNMLREIQDDWGFETELEPFELERNRNIVYYPIDSFIVEAVSEGQVAKEEFDVWHEFASERYFNLLSFPYVPYTLAARKLAPHPTSYRTINNWTQSVHFTPESCAALPDFTGMTISSTIFSNNTYTQDWSFADALRQLVYNLSADHNNYNRRRRP